MVLEGSWQFRCTHDNHELISHFTTPWFEVNWTWATTKFRVVAHLRCPVDYWTVRKHCKKILEMMGAFVGFWKSKSISSSLPSKSGEKSSWLWRFVSGRVSEYWIAVITVDKWASLLYSSNCLAKRHVSLCQTCVRQSRYGCLLSGSSKCWFSNVCAALGSGLATRSMVNKRVSVS